MITKVFLQSNDEIEFDSHRLNLEFHTLEENELLDVMQSHHNYILTLFWKDQCNFEFSNGFIRELGSLDVNLGITTVEDI